MSEPIDTEAIRNLIRITGEGVELKPGVTLVMGRFGFPSEVVLALCDEIDRLKSQTREEQR